MSLSTTIDNSSWSLVVAASQSPSPQARAALEELCGNYWYAVYAFVRRRGKQADDARDLTQEFFARLLEKEYLEAADRERGRFRTFLLTAVAHFLSNEHERACAQKRPAKLPPKVLANKTSPADGILTRLFAWTAGGLRASGGALTSFFAPIPPLGKPLSSQSQLRIRRENVGPGTAMILVGILGFLHPLLILPAMVNYYQAFGRQKNDAFVLLMTTIILTLCQIPVSTLLILGGFHMRRTINLGLVLIAALMGLLPLGPAWLVSSPVAIWAISILFRRDVRLTFHEQQMDD